MEEPSGIAKRPAKPGGARAQSAEGIGALTLVPSMVSVRRDLGRAGVFGASEWCRGLGDLSGSGV